MSTHLSTDQTLLHRIDVLKQRIDALRPLSKEFEATLQERLRIEWTYNSNALEGNSLTFGETAFFLREGLTSEGKPLKDYLEAKNHAEAIDGLHEIIRNERPLSESLIKELHAVLLSGVKFTLAKDGQGQFFKKPLHPGQYKIHPNHVLTLSGKIHRYADPIHVKDEMEALLKWFHQSKNLHPVERAGLFHYRFVAIHPFEDGNGRLARLLMNLILMKEGYPPCIIQNAHRREYLGVLEKADIEKKTAPFVEFIATELMNTLQTMVDILEGEPRSEPLGKSSFKLNAVQRERLVLETLREGPLAIGQIHEKLRQISRATLKSDLQRLIRQKKLRREGKGKGVLYNDK